MTEQRQAFQPVKSADRTLEVLETLAAAPRRMSLVELSRQLGVPKSSMHGVLKTMERRGWVEADGTGTRFSLGMRALLVGAAYVESDDAVSQAQPVLDWLSDSIGETVHLGRLDGPDIVYLAKRESKHPLRMYSALGRRLPAYATALGKALLAQRRPREVDELYRWPLARLTDNTICEREAFQTELAGIRKRGHALDHEENAEGISCFAVHLNTGTPPTDAISISIPVFRITGETEREAVYLLHQAKSRLEAHTRLRR